MSEVLDAWRRERDRCWQVGLCACPTCLEYPNADQADRWRPGKPIPEGWQLEQGWGLTCTEPWWPISCREHAGWYEGAGR